MHWYAFSAQWTPAFWDFFRKKVVNFWNILLWFFQGESRFLKQDWIEGNSPGKNALHLKFFSKEPERTRMRILLGRQWSRKLIWRECLIANLTNRIAISETLATRSRNSFSQERGFVLAGNARMFNCKSYELRRIAILELIR